jgi:signal transduction histidine kinase
MTAGQARDAGEASNIELWLRANAIVSSYSPWCIWLLHDSIRLRKRNGFIVLVKSFPVFIIGIFLSLLCLLESFVVSNGSIFIRGSVYYLHTFIVIALFSIASLRILRGIPTESGIRRIELQYLALNAGSVALLLAILNGLGNYFHLRAFNRASIFVVFGAYLFMAWALAHRKIFNAGQVLISVGQRTAVAGVMTASAWALASLFSEVTDPAPAWLGSVFACGLGAFWLDRQTRSWLGLEGLRPLALLRAEIIEGAYREAAPADLMRRFEQILSRYHDASSAAILERCAGKYCGSGIDIAVQQPGFSLLCEEGWTTPESLQRRRQVPDLLDLGGFLESHALGVVVTAPATSLTPSVLIAVGRKTNEAPYTFPEVQRLQNVAELIDNLLTHSKLTNQVVLQSRLEHLAMVAKGLAHDLKNLMTPVTEFLADMSVYLPAGTRQAEVRAEAQRAVNTMSDYLRETLFFSQRLKPRLADVNLSRMLEAVQSAVKHRAGARGVTVEVDQVGSPSLIADQTLIQRLLTNLVANAIDASSAGQLVSLVVSDEEPGWTRFTVQDVGHGMSAETASRIFEPYFSTKDREGEIQGFGLGLTISQTIVNLHDGRISVVSHPGRGTCMTVHVPSLPSGMRATGQSA